MTTWLIGRSPHPNIAIAETPMWYFTLAGLGIVCLFIYQADKLLGLFGAYMVARSAFTATPFAFEGAQAIVFGVLFLVCAARTPARWRPWVLQAIGGILVLQTGYAIIESLGYEPLWTGWTKVPLPHIPWIHGAIGNPNHFGSFLVIAASIAPPWALPFAVASVLLSRSFLAAVTLSLVLFLRFRHRWRFLLPVLAVFVAGAMFIHHSVYMSGVFVWPWVFPNAWLERFDIFGMALRLIRVSPIFGFGPNSYQHIGPAIQRTPEFKHILEVFSEMHNDILQLIFEGGAVAGLLVFLWAMFKRRALLSDSGLPTTVAVIVQSLFSFPFHLPQTGVLAVTALGLTVAEEKADGKKVAEVSVEHGGFPTRSGSCAGTGRPV